MKHTSTKQKIIICVIYLTFNFTWTWYIYFSLLNLATLFPAELRPSSTQCNSMPVGWIYFFLDFILSNPSAPVP